MKLASLLSALLLSPAAASAAPATPEASAAPAPPPTSAAPATPEASSAAPTGEAAATGGGRWESRAPAPAPAPGAEPPACRDAVADDPVLDAALRALTIQVGDREQALAGVRMAGLAAVNETALWAALGGRPASPDAGDMALLVRRLAGLELFAAITPVLELGGKDGATLVVNVVEHPAVRKVTFEGLGELRPEGLLDALLDVPARSAVEQRRLRPRPAGAARAAADDARRPRCPDPLPPREWLARAEGQVVFPGVVWRGLAPALDRVMDRIFDKGYEMASIAGELAADGTLTIRVDEGRFERLQIEGVEPRIEPRVRELLGLAPGEPFVRGDVDGAAGRLRARFPFLRPDRGRRQTRRVPAVSIVPAAGGLRFQAVEQPPREQRRWFAVAGRTVTLYLESERFSTSFDARDIIRHTPVTSFAPGLDMKTTVWNPTDLVHLHIRAAANVNTRRARAPMPASGERDRWRFDWMAGGHAQVPDARIAELGAVGYARVDTADRWRIDPIDSYIYSLLINRPDSESFRRDGFTAYVTAHLADHLTAGAEYRRDRYRSLVSSDDVFTIFNRDEAPAFTPPIDDGRMASLLFRLELTSEGTPAHDVGASHRDPERTIVGHDRGEYLWTELRTVNTLEVADEGLGGDFNFVRLVSDSAAFIATGHEQGLLVRFRAAGKLGGQLPAQKQEALGGWSALRGYDFKELRGGDFALLGTVEYRLSGPSVFLDVGSLHADGSWGTAKVGAGAALNLGDEAQFVLAWRTDDEARLRPELRLLFQRAF
jgi:hypothetical protein